MVWAVVLNILSAVFNIFSFTLIIPILQILFGLDTTVYQFIPWESDIPVKDLVMNNMYYYMTECIDRFGGSNTLIIIGLFMALMTALRMEKSHLQENIVSQQGYWQFVTF